MTLNEMNVQQIADFKKDVQKAYDDFKALGLSLDMSRGKPAPVQLDLTMPMMECLSASDKLISENGFDCRNYGVLDGIPEAKKLMGDMMGVKPEEVIVYGNASLNAMYDTIARAMTHGINGSTPWAKLDEIKFLCPAPGYDRHFAICEFFGIKMITIPMTADGPDMDMVEQYVNNDESVKGIWCVPQYSNPQGICYSDETVKRFAALNPKAADFRIFWDNAYCIHHLTDNHPTVLNILDECKKTGREDMPLIFASTSKISFSGAGIAAMAASVNNISNIKKQLAVATIGYDKINQLRHVKFFKDINGLNEHMKKHRDIILPKFETVLNALDREIAPLGIGSWHKPDGGYFISFDAPEGCAKRIVQLCKEAGVVLTNAGATFPYGNDPKDSNIRIAPTYPTVDELEKAMELFCICVKLAAAEKIAK
ncbi:MAG: aminotransferase class I/II-fold pyridoxal phosphate-dependent enzyme [Oscillospiraceae bacterium]